MLHDTCVFTFPWPHLSLRKSVIRVVQVLPKKQTPSAPSQLLSVWSVSSYMRSLPQRVSGTCECGLWCRFVIFLQLAVLSLFNFTTIYWIIKCIAFTPPRPNGLSLYVNDSEKWFVYSPCDSDLPHPHFLGRGYTLPASFISSGQ